METATAVRPAWRHLGMEVAVIFFLSLLLAGIRVSRSEPPNPRREGRAELAGEGPGRLRRVADPNANRHYDRVADEADFYAPVIQQMHGRWPRIDLAEDTFVEKPPGYPFLMASVAQVTGLDFRWLRGAQMLLSACIPALLFLWLRRRISRFAAAATIAPLLCSSFFIKSSSYLTTDNPALLCTVVVLTTLLLERAATSRLFALMVGATAAASFRQDALWLAAPIVARRALAGPWARWKNAERETTLPWRQRWLLLGAVMLPLVLVGRMVMEWGALVPQAHVRGVAEPGVSPMPVVYLLSVAALFWWPWVVARHGIVGAWTRVRGRAVLLAGLAGLALALVTNSQYGLSLGHWGGYLWSIAAATPAIAGRSLVFLILAPLGALALGLVGVELARERPRAAVVLAAAMACWAAACCFNPLVFHRYYEPPLLVFLVLAAGLLPPARVRSGEIRDNAPLLVVSAAQLFITVVTLYFSLFALWRR